MRPTIPSVLAGTILLAIPAVCGSLVFPTPSVTERVVITASDAFVMLTPEPIAGPEVKQAAVAPDGRFVLVEREVIREQVRAIQETVEGRPPAGERRLSVWVRETRATHDLWRAPLGASIQQIEWLPASPAAFLLVSEVQDGQPRRSLVRLNAETRKSEGLGLTDLGDIGRLDLYPSPARPLVVLRHVPLVPAAEPGAPPRPGRAALYLLGRTGALSVYYAVPEGKRLESLQWSEDGSPLVLVRDLASGKFSWLQLDPRTAEARELAQPPSFYRPPAPDAASPLRLVRSTGTLRERETARGLKLLWLEGARDSRTLVSAESAGGHLLPSGNGIIYESRGTLFMVPFFRLPRATYETLAAGATSAERIYAINQGKQLGQALLLYLRDHDQSLPTPDGIREKLQPYARESVSFETFTYTYPGGRLPAGAAAGETEVGVLEENGVRVRIYANGSVRADP